MADEKKGAGAAPVAPAVKPAASEMKAPKADVVQLEVPGDITSLGIEGQTFAVVSGVVEVPLVLAAAARSYLEPLWRKSRGETKRALDAAKAALERAQLPGFGRELLDRVEKLEREVFNR